jgi:hypothetical protein
MNKWISYLFIGIGFSYLPLHASFNKSGYQPLRNEEEIEYKHKAKKSIALKEEESLIEEVKPTIHPAYEQYLLYCTEKQIDGDIEDLKRKLAGVFINFPHEAKFMHYLISFYSYPNPLSKELYYAIKQNLSSPVKLFKTVSKFEPNKKKAFSKKLEAFYLREEENIKRTMSSLPENSIEEIKLQAYKLGKLYYFYALTFESPSVKRDLYLKKAQNQFNEAQEIKKIKIEKYTEAIKNLIR